MAHNPQPIGLSAPDITAAERRAVAAVLRRPQLAMGPETLGFEAAFAKYLGMRHAIAVNSGTTGLHLAVRALGLKRGDEVVTSPLSFIASSNCLLYEGVRPVFVDVDPLTLNIDPDRIERAVTRRTKALLPVDLFGLSCDWGPIRDIARRRRLPIIEDSCEALGATHHGRKCGTFGDLSAFGFYPNKQMTTGEGGMVVTNSHRLAGLIRSMRNQGRSIVRPAWLIHERLGYNARMSEITAAIGRVQVGRLPELLARRDRVAARYTRLLRDVPGVTPLSEPPGLKRSWFVYSVWLAPTIDRSRVAAALAADGIQTGFYFPPIHLQPLYRKEFGYRPGAFPVAEYAGERMLALPFHNRLAMARQQRVAKTLQGALS